jgi:hypothetical protein
MARGLPARSRRAALGRAGEGVASGGGRGGRAAGHRAHLALRAGGAVPAPAAGQFAGARGAGAREPQPRVGPPSGGVHRLGHPGGLPAAGTAAAHGAVARRRAAMPDAGAQSARLPHRGGPRAPVRRAGRLARAGRGGGRPATLRAAEGLLPSAGLALGSGANRSHAPGRAGRRRRGPSPLGAAVADVGHRRGQPGGDRLPRDLRAALQPDGGAGAHPSGAAQGGLARASGNWT